MTNDLISREAAKEAVKYIPWCDWSAVGRTLDELPSVDAAPVVNAKWHLCRMNVPKGHGQMYSAWRCSACHKHERKRSDYCPNCGAKMEAKHETD